MPVPLDLIVVLKKERFDLRGQFHVQIEHIDRERNYEENSKNSEEPKKDLSDNLFHDSAFSFTLHLSVQAAFAA